MIKQMKNIWINPIRLPICPDTLRNVKVTGINYYNVNHEIKIVLN
jgi:hypothetical protein